MSGIDLVTGGAGCIGSHLVDLLVREGRQVRVIDNLSTSKTDGLAERWGDARVRFIEGDVSQRHMAEVAVEGCERVFHLAALARIIPSIEQPADYFRANVAGTFTICEAARQAGVKRFIYAASSSCYGIPDIYPTPEGAPLRPQFPYALTKMLGEEIVLHWAKVYGMHAVSLRFFMAYGPRLRTAVFAVWLAQLLAGQPLTIVGDGTEERDFIYVTDIARACKMAADRAASGSIYNVGTGRSVSINRCVELLGATKTVHLSWRAGEPHRTLADISRIRREIGWEPEVSIEDGIALMLKEKDYWRGMPVSTPESIAKATEAWNHYLGTAA